MTQPTQSLEEMLILKLYGALKRISQYQSPESLRRHAESDYGLDAEEAIEYAYDNVRHEAAAAIKGVRIKKYEASHDA